MTRRRVAILFSGRGSNMAALMAAAENPAYPARIVLALTNKPKAPGRALAEAAGIRCLALDHRLHGRDRSAHEAAIQAALTEAATEMVCLAGYMRLLTPFLVDRWAGRMLNIHPSLLPAFPGLDTHARALAAGVRLHGCTVHYVTHATDEGPIIAQAAVPVLPNDNAERLAARVLAQEHVLYPLALHLAADPDARTSPPDPRRALLNPLPVLPALT